MNLKKSKNLILLIIALIPCSLFGQENGFSYDVFLYETNSLSLSFFSQSGEIKTLSPSLFEEESFNSQQLQLSLPRQISKNREILTYALNPNDIKVINLKNNQSFYLSDYLNGKSEYLDLQNISDNGEFILYTSKHSGSYNLNLFNTLKKTVKTIFTIDAEKNRIANSAFARKNKIIFVVRPRTTDRKTILYSFDQSLEATEILSRNFDSFGDLSNEGNLIFSTGHGGTQGFINIYTHKVTTFLQTGEYSFNYKWSENNKYIAWVSTEDDKFTIFIVDMKTKKIFRKVSVPNYTRCLGWFANDHKLLFSYINYKEDHNPEEFYALNIVTGSIENISEQEKIYRLETMACPILNLYEEGKYVPFKEILTINIEGKMEGVSLDKNSLWRHSYLPGKWP